MTDSAESCSKEMDSRIPTISKFHWKFRV